MPRWSLVMIFNVYQPEQTSLRSLTVKVGSRQFRFSYVVLALFVVVALVATVIAVVVGLNEQAARADAESAPIHRTRINTSGVGPLYKIEPTTALALLKTVPVRGNDSKRGYARTNFGQSWTDVDNNGCDTRDDVLSRDMTGVKYVRGSRCLVASGMLKDPYTGKTIDFKRGAETSAAVQIDHIVALSDAWQKGAQEITAAQRMALANDPLNLIAVDGPTNTEKSDADASGWLPPKDSYRCNYVARQISVKAAYGLWVSSAEASAMRGVLTSCPQQRTYTSGLV